MLSVIYDDYSSLVDFFDNIYGDSKKNCLIISDLHKTKEYYHKSVNTSNKENIKKLIQNTVKIVTSNGFKINPSRYYVEFHKYNVNGKTKPFADFHEDDEGAVYYKTVTCIYYLTKSDTVIGGDLEFKNERIINIDSNMLVVFNGNLTHRATTMYGIGVRKSIVIQFERIE
jgi:hypothetical protein